MKKIWCVSDGDELLSVLRRVNVRVPDRAEGRTKEHTERYAIARLLSTIPHELEFPFMLVHDDRPDFIIVSISSRIGIEHSEIVPENVARASFLRSKGHGPEVYFLPHAKYGEDRRTAQQIKSEIELDELGSGWIGDGPERGTAEAIVGFAQRKVESSQKLGYRIFDRNWLLLENNWPAPALDIYKSVSFAHPGLVEHRVFEIFKYVFVETDSDIAILSADSFSVVPLVNPGVEV
ncbi:hypothetical protein [Rhodanobacter ginsengiterrae]|uniref:hypothetical protein n=1 Tax=Rhodanobacter ginsengiterrae TaxID=2008451 RepID=UPI003CF7C44A